MSDEKTPPRAPNTANLARRDISQNNINSVSGGSGSVFNFGHSLLDSPPLPTLAICSRPRATEKLAHETDDMLGLLKHFNDRAPKNPRSYEAAAAEVIEFFSDSRRASDLRKRDHALHLDCLLSLAFAAGYAASRNTGMKVFPIQKPDMTVWKPEPSSRKEWGTWHATSHPREASALDVAVGLSVTSSVLRDATSYLDTPGAPAVQALVELQPCPPGSSTPRSDASAIIDANHAYQLGVAFKAELDRWRPPGGCVHLFAAGPAGLMFFLGQHREGLGCVQLYEHDFETRTYRPSLRFDAGRLIPVAT